MREPGHSNKASMMVDNAVGRIDALYHTMVKAETDWLWHEYQAREDGSMYRTAQALLRANYALHGMATRQHRGLPGHWLTHAHAVTVMPYPYPHGLDLGPQFDRIKLPDWLDIEVETGLIEANKRLLGSIPDGVEKAGHSTQHALLLVRDRPADNDHLDPDAYAVSAACATVFQRLAAFNAEQRIVVRAARTVLSRAVVMAESGAFLPPKLGHTLSMAFTVMPVLRHFVKTEEFFVWHQMPNMSQADAQMFMAGIDVGLLMPATIRLEKFIEREKRPTLSPPLTDGPTFDILTTQATKGS